MELTIKVEDKEAPFVIELLKKFSFVEFVENKPRTLKKQLVQQVEELWLVDGQKVFASKDDFLRWLNSSNRSLQNKKPIAILAHKDGYQIVNALLGRLIHGIMA